MELDAELTGAVVLYTGWGQKPYPAREGDRIIEAFGHDRGLDLIPKVHRLEDDFFESDARFTTDDLAEMGKKAAYDFRKAHPEIGGAAVEALAWCYTFDFK